MMRKNNGFSKSTGIAVVMMALVVVGAACSPGKSTYGAPIDMGKGSAVQLRQIFANTQEYEAKNVIVEGTTGQICQASGCWLMLTDGTHQLFVQFYTFTAQLRTGSRVRVQGVLKSQNQVPYLVGEGLEIMG